MSDAKPSVEELAELLRSIELGTGSESKDLHLATWALRFRARGVREALEEAAKELRQRLEDRYGKDVPEAYARIGNEACGLLRRLAAEVTDAD